MESFLMPLQIHDAPTDEVSVLGRSFSDDLSLERRYSFDVLPASWKYTVPTEENLQNVVGIIERFMTSLGTRVNAMLSERNDEKREEIIDRARCHTCAMIEQWMGVLMFGCIRSQDSSLEIVLKDFDSRYDVLMNELESGRFLPVHDRRNKRSQKYHSLAITHDMEQGGVVRARSVEPLAIADELVVRGEIASTRELELALLVRGRSDEEAFIYYVPREE